MLHFRYMLPLQMAVLIAILLSSVMAASKNSFEPINDHSEMTKDVEAYASYLKTDLDTATRQLALQDSAGKLDATLARNEADTYAGLWIQHSPQFRIVVQFTQEGNETIRPYIESETIADYVETRIAEYTLKELEAAQVATQLEIRNLGIPTNSGINVIDNKVELYIVERSRFDVAMQAAKIQLLPQVRAVTVSELSTQETDIYAGLRLNAANGADCTSGFSVINPSGVKGILTAAHCNDTMSYNGVSLPFQNFAYGGSYDYQWHSAPGFDVQNWAWDGEYIRYINSTKHRDNQVVGEFVSKFGWASGYTWGFISDKNFNPGGAMNNTLIRVHRDGINLSSAGDSGGPWFSSNTAYGLHVGSIGDDAYYMAINYIDALGLSVLTTANSYIYYLPLLMNDLTQSENITEPDYGNPYPSPDDDNASIELPSNPEPNPYP
jgi:hypothetical protein